MKIHPLLLLIFLPTIGYSQNLNNLDEKYGFNKFKLESRYENFKSDLTYLFTDNEVYKDGVKYYKYNKNDVSVFGNKFISEIGLGFYKGKLYTINIDMGMMTDTELSRIFSKFVDLFGEPNVSMSEPNVDYELRRQWTTPKTLLGFERRGRKSNYKPSHVNIFLISHKLKKEISNDGF